MFSSGAKQFSPNYHLIESSTKSAHKFIPFNFLSFSVASELKITKLGKLITNRELTSQDDTMGAETKVIFLQL